MGFYPFEQKTGKCIGTLHVYLVDYNIDLRGIKVFQVSKNSFKFRMPVSYGIDKDTKEKVWFPIFSFMGEGKNAAFFKAIKEKAVPLIKENI